MPGLPQRRRGERVLHRLHRVWPHLSGTRWHPVHARRGGVPALRGGDRVSGMRDLIADIPEQLRWSASLAPPDMPFADEALVVGMGGSGVAGDVAAVFAEAQGRRGAV